MRLKCYSPVGQLKMGPERSVQHSKIAVIVLSGASDIAPDLDMFRSSDDSTRTFIRLQYPGWRSYVGESYSAAAIVDDLVGRIQSQVPEGPIYIAGISIGGHFGYAAALRLQELGRDVAGFCAIDTFMMSSAAPSEGWSKRALKLASRLMLGLKFTELGEFIRTRFWRACLRLAGDSLPRMLGPYATSGKQPWVMTLDPSLERELSMRLLIQHAAPFVVALDQNPRPLNVPTVLLRTELNSEDDAAWKLRCPRALIRQLPGDHQTLLEQQSLGVIREAFVAATSDWH